jgi:hypothetical protein
MDRDLLGHLPVVIGAWRAIAAPHRLRPRSA